MAKKEKGQQAKVNQKRAKQSKKKQTGTAATKQATTSKSASTPLPAPVFHEPVFSEGTFLRDPTGFVTPHDVKSDDALYKKLGDKLKTDVVTFSQAQGAPNTLFALSEVQHPTLLWASPFQIEEGPGSRGMLLRPRSTYFKPSARY